MTDTPKPEATTPEILPESQPKPAETVPEFGGRKGPDPVRYGDWEKGGIAVDF